MNADDCYPTSGLLRSRTRPEVTIFRLHPVSAQRAAERDYRFFFFGPFSFSHISCFFLLLLLYRAAAEIAPLLPPPLPLSVLPLSSARGGQKNARFSTPSPLLPLRQRWLSTATSVSTSPSFRRLNEDIPFSPGEMCVIASSAVVGLSS